jgi:hypothetical protein
MAIETALQPFFEWIDNHRIYDQPVLSESFLTQFKREHGIEAVMILIVLKNILLYSTDERDSPTLISKGCNRYIEAILKPTGNLGTKNIFNLLLANTSGAFNGITEENKEAMRAYISEPKGGKRKSRRSRKANLR